ncbi:hypothetical protein F4824DRAFT_499570 [Ustulina deusta]|nr:hypothetical protein F4823DRAFT_559574 [Ustulina deusta]KAI3338238.1 hypothetical protein F4824DRAFT_499570 [Ustulina deusta]
MKANLASTLAYLPLLAIVSAFAIPYYEKMSLSSAHCQNIRLTDGHVLHATCTNPAQDPAITEPVDLSLDLDSCFANYLGTLNYVSDGGFSSSCSACHLVDTKLVCECSVGQGLGTKHNEYELNYWRTIRLTLEDFNLQCGSTEGVEKRADNKEARPFVA